MSRKVTKATTRRPAKVRAKATGTGPTGTPAATRNVHLEAASDEAKMRTLPPRGTRLRLRVPALPAFATTPAARFRAMFHVLVGLLELPVDRNDLLLPPTDPYFQQDGYDAIVPLDARRAMYMFIFHGSGVYESVLDQWLGDAPLEALKLHLMRQKIAAAGMGVDDFSRLARPLVPLSGDRWRADGNVVSALMREIAIHRAEQFQRASVVAHLSMREEEDYSDRVERIETLQRQLAELGRTAKELPWTGPEPTRLTYNRLVENGDEEDPMAHWSGSCPTTTLERWEMGIRRLALERALEALDLDQKTLMLDEVLMNKITVYVELGLGTPQETAESIREAMLMHKTQWTRRKRRTERWAFNFDYPPEDEDDDVDNGDE